MENIFKDRIAISFGQSFLSNTISSTFHRLYNLRNLSVDFLKEIISSKKKKPIQRRAKTITLNCRLRKEDMEELAQLVNSYRMFKTDVTADTLFSLLNENAKAPICAHNLMALSFLLDRLSSEGLIGRYWQAAISRKGLILQRNGLKPQTNSGLSTALNKANKTKRECFKDIAELAKKLGKKHNAM